MAGLDLVQGDLEHQIGSMGLGAHAEIGGEQDSQIELVDRLVDGAGEMVGGQGVLDRQPLGGLRIPGRRGEAIEFGTVLGWRWVERYRKVERAARPVERAMVLRSRWEYHRLKGSFRRRCRVPICNPKTREPLFAISPKTRRKRDDLFGSGMAGYSPSGRSEVSCCRAAGLGQGGHRSNTTGRRRVVHGACPPAHFSRASTSGESDCHCFQSALESFVRTRVQDAGTCPGPSGAFVAVEALRVVTSRHTRGSEGSG